MAMHPELTPTLIEFIRRQHIFFTGTAAKDGRVNVSPKGLDAMRVISPQRLLWLNLTGSGNETAAHLLDINRLTLMWCSFDEKPLILRVYGYATMLHPGDADWAEAYAHFPPDDGARQIFDVTITEVQTSCGFGVPMYEFHGDRSQLTDWSIRKGAVGVRDYWRQKNSISTDGYPTDIEPDEPKE